MDRRQFVRKGLGITTAMNPGMLASLEDQESSTIHDIKSFGAKGDGKTDDSNAFIKAVASKAGHIFLSKGSYRISKTIHLTLSEIGTTSIVGDGSARVVMAGKGPAFFFHGSHNSTADPKGFKDIVWNQERMPLISGFEIRGANAEAIGLQVEGTMQATITSLLIRRCQHGIVLSKRNRNPIISHCHIYHNLETGIFFDRVNLHQAIISNNHISYNPHAGIKIWGGEMRNFQITGNDIEYNYDENNEGSADILIDNQEKGTSFREGSITGNTIQARPSPKGANVRILGGENYLSGGLLAITGNLLGSQQDGIHLDRCRGVSITGNSLYSATDRTLRVERSNNIVFSGNTIDWNPSSRGKRYYGDNSEYVDGIYISECDGVIIADSIFENCFAGSKEFGGVIEAHKSENIQINDCQILDPRYRGVVFKDVVRSRVQGCTIVRRNEKTLNTLPGTIEVHGKSHFCIITQNMLSPVKPKITSKDASNSADGNYQTF